MEILMMLKWGLLRPDEIGTTDEPHSGDAHQGSIIVKKTLTNIISSPEGMHNPDIK
ncbi:MAG: hypothetical protein NTU98_12050 [Bacteroidetes bacterium]|nr:hypothetical protein [Bacteroidota bacterium]